MADIPELKQLYQGAEFLQEDGKKEIRLTFYGTETEIDDEIADHEIGEYADDYGYLSAMRKSQMEGEFYKLEMTYKEESEPSDPEIGIAKPELSVRCIQLPLERASKYKACWNHYLAGRKSAIPSWWSTATNTTIPAADMQDYKWLKNVSDIPLPSSPDEEVVWQILKNPLKPGVEVYDFAVYVVTVTTPYASASAAGQGIQKAINKITTPPETFSITGGNWKQDSANVRFDGKYWLAVAEYTHSPDGWDQDLYDQA